MKGQVKIILKSPNGDIVKEVEQTNRVFDIPKKIMTEMFPLTVQNSYKYGTSDSSTSMNVNIDNLMFSMLLNIKDWFRSIKINDEFFEEDGEGNIIDSAYKDWKIPQVYGSDNVTLANPSNSRYTYANTNYSVENNNIKKLYYSWTMPAPADPQNPQTYFTMKSISLCHYDQIGRIRSNTYCNLVSPYKNFELNNLIFKYGSFYFGYDSSIMSTASPSSNASGITNLFKNPSYDWSKKRFVYTKHLTVGSDSPGYYYPSIIPLHNNEILLARLVSNVTENDTSTRVKYISIIDNQTGDLKRQFDLTQFQDMGVSDYSNSNLTTRTSSTPLYLNFVTTPTKNYLIQYAPYKYNAYSSGASYQKTIKTRIWEIPNTQEGYVLPVACVGTRSQDTTVNPEKEYYTQNTSDYAGRIPGELVDENGYLYTLVENPSGNPYSKGYYEVVKGVNGTQIPYIELQGDSSIISSFEAINTSYYMYNSYSICNKFIYGDYILEFKDTGVSIIQRYISNTYTMQNATAIPYLARYIGKLDIPGLQYGLSNYGYQPLTFPVWYNTSCMNLSEPIDIPEGYTLTVEYTITAN